MSDYRKEADRLRMLRQTQQQGSPSLQLPTRGPIQAEYHRPAANVHALVQRHYFPEEGLVLDGVGEPANADVADAADVADRLSKYQNLCQRRAAETSKAIQAEKDAKMKLALSTRERLQNAKAFGLRVALGNLKASPRNPTKGKGLCQRSSSSAARNVQRCAHDRGNGRLQNNRAATRPEPSTCERSGQQLNQLQGQATNLNRVAKAYKGRPLPLVVSVDDEPGMARIAQKVSELREKLELPRLCACPNRANIFDPTYVTKCARNCPLYMQPERFASLLTTWLREKDII
ncbi:hypothetical protein VOLCADRAFT_99320 [Volvox carteri f. nagariensis]|uniref:Uncharacterized protein n=1 Tax=Volvox carteri f. nagariensis TaxID=3068 RepID=D8UHI6_VOLCA|nr:uncharacterized protein VOLCADRAFT_99320 [Volvox carteri f. nagariensis]EFJ40832.1 hypothetical protein VOLCADRAFT_99320 [Volvox carteri f. nagariensis]|eukprot:XP_002958101.1 hypothetical protein VOLCADRAFT_99320 [Volvox carteri f. nagariensis]